MFRNYFKTAWRYIIRNKFYSAITVLGLTIGLAVGLLILFWVNDERSIDAYHSKAKDIYKLENRVGTGESRQIWTHTASAIGYLGKTEVPAIKDMVRFSYDNYFSKFRINNEKIHYEEFIFADPTLFSMFDFPLIKGNKTNPFPDNNSVVITAGTAKKYFGDADPMGQTIQADDSVNMTVTGVIANLPGKSSFRFNMVFPIDIINRRYTDATKKPESNFQEYNYATYLQLQPGTNLAALSTTLRNLHLRTKPDDTDVEYLFLPLTQSHLYHSDGTEAAMGAVRMFTIIAIIILAIACINYVNLSTARAMLRAKEVSLRKIVGAGRLQLFAQFVVETAIVFVMATILALGLIALLMPMFNQLAGKQMLFDPLSPDLWKTIGLTIAGTLVISSIYPALLLSSFDPLKAIRGKISVRVNDVFFRRALVVVQFCFSVILIISTFVIARQLHFIASKKLGYNKENTFAFFVGVDNNLAALKQELSKSRAVTSMALSDGLNIVNMANQTGNNDFDGKQPNSTFMVYPMAINQDFIPFFQIEMAAGRNFSGMPADSAHFILNETAIKTTGIKNPVGKRFTLQGVKGTIIGVVKDFHFASVKSKIEPAIFRYHNKDNWGRLYVRTTGEQTKAAVDVAEKVWNKFNPGVPIGYSFLDETYHRLYTDEQRTGKLFNLFAGIAIFISCMGLLGLTAYTAQVRTREIGVRKVLGATVPGIVSLLARDFLLLVLVAICIASPVAWYVMDKWLGDFAYRVDIGWTVFVLSAGLSILIALLTISFQSIRAALANPIRSLRTD
ncbi:MAG: ABC transporter permease [Chitinophagaceae bacterium]|nr:MAG: ABC transporter permease [Chitinophagaceae bacterium]